MDAGTTMRLNGGGDDEEEGSKALNWDEDA
jgi:hypothetical protein